MSAVPQGRSPSAGDLDAAADQAIAAYGADAREAVKTLIPTTIFLGAQVEELRTALPAVFTRQIRPATVSEGLVRLSDGLR